MKRRALFGLLAAAGLGLALGGPALAEDQPSGTITINSTSIALGIGVTWGDGELTYQGKVYKFSVDGLSVIDLGIASVSAAGKVYHLDKIEDFAGNYVSGQAGAAIGGGVAGIHMQNQHGVIINLTATQSGAKLTLAAQGMQIELKE